MVDVVYVSWNRLLYTQHSFKALLDNTDWSLVDRLFLADDASTDGTREWLDEQAGHLGDVAYEFLPAPFGGPVEAVNRYLDRATPGVERFAKIDNDTVVPPGWLPELLRLMENHPDVDLLGMAPRYGPPQSAPYEGRGIELAPFVDGNGLWRHRTFVKGGGRPGGVGPGGRFGMTEYQEQRPQIIKAWANPDLPVFQLDGLPFEPWVSVAAGYVARGWQRYWPPMSPDATGYWEWWTRNGG